MESSEVKEGSNGMCESNSGYVRDKIEDFTIKVGVNQGSVAFSPSIRLHL